MHFWNLLCVVIVIDSQMAGVSGDMMLSSLVHLGASKSKVLDAVHASESFLQGSKIEKIAFKKVNKHGIRATMLDLRLDEHHHERNASEIHSCIKKTARKIGLSARAESFATKAIETLIDAESQIHGVPKDSVHFHEASSIDTVIDIVGCAVAFDDLRCFDHEIVATPVAVGSGTVTFSHGTVSNPAGAILEIFKKSNLLMCGSSVREELTTPTGASILASVADRCSESYPLMSVQAIGYGAGQKNLEGISNVLKVVQGSPSDGLKSDRVCVLETNVDDVSGEILAYTIEKIMSAGARDVTITPTVAKKGRPGYLVAVICDTDSADHLAALLMSETGTLGIRMRTSERLVASRQILTLKVILRGRPFTVRCKVASTNEHKQFKVEYDDVAEISKKTSLSFRRTEELINEEVRKQLK